MIRINLYLLNAAENEKKMENCAEVILQELITMNFTEPKKDMNI